MSLIVELALGEADQQRGPGALGMDWTRKALADAPIREEARE
jgi:hypothetical protein